MATASYAVTQVPPTMLTPPPGDTPCVVWASFEFRDINAIHDEAETFEFTGVMTLRWMDARLAFDPAVVGVKEQVFQGEYQFNELAAGWYPQVVLVNESGMLDKHGVVLRVKPDGSCTLIETINATAKCTFRMRRFPFDSQQLQAKFQVLGFDRDSVELRVDPEAGAVARESANVPQWTIQSAGLSVVDKPEQYGGTRAVTTTFVANAHVARDAFYICRLIVIPLTIIVLLSFSVFWMDRSSLGDRLGVSFIGILTGVAFQLVISDFLPRISYFTLVHGFVNLSFLTMCA
ncbi:MAG: hypothetical protein JNK53_00360, partial [Phycisphaerae bacterium]|nr:hypothetical protein [Phycisphaerae bacterium]